MTYRRRCLIFPHLLSSSRVIGVRHRGLWNGILVGIALILLLFTLQNGQATAAMAGSPFTAQVVVSTDQTFSPAYWRDFYTSHRLRYLARLRLISAENWPALNNNPSLTPASTSVSRGVVLSREVLQTAFGPEQLFMLNVDLTSPNLGFGVVQAYNRLISPDETLTSMAHRTGAVAGINGDYFEIHGPGVPI